MNASKQCLFCDKTCKFVKGHWQYLQVFVTIDPIKSKAQEINDNLLLAKINDFCEKNQTMFYHKLCKQNYEYKSESQLGSHTQKFEWH